MYHTLILVGNLGNDPEMRYIANGQAVTKFSVATNRQYKNSEGQTVKETVWFRVSVWGKQAESSNNFLKKGSKVLIEGRLNADPSSGGPRIWTGNDNVARASYEVTANMVRFLTTKGEPGTGGMEDAGDTGVSEEEIPF
jgi:single-strand DNA-binding protein